MVSILEEVDQSIQKLFGQKDRGDDGRPTERIYKAEEDESERKV